MIYMSSGNVCGSKISERVERLASAGFNKIELSGGVRYYSQYLRDLLELKEQYDIKYLIHNYFPPPKEDFVLNLASLDKDIRNKSINLSVKAIQDAAVLGSSHYSVHAGFYFDPEIEELGKKIKFRKLYNLDKSKKAFKESIETLKRAAFKHSIKLYIENNVVNVDSYKSLQQSIPSMLLCYDDVVGLQSDIGKYNFLLDIGHLKVTMHTLGMDFESECRRLIDMSDYLHISDNNELWDEHKCFFQGSSLFQMLRGYDLSAKIIVLEMHDSIENIQISYDLIDNVMTARNEGIGK